MRGANPEKLFFKIGEVSDIVGVKPHVLRYWESEFAFLQPRKTGSGHRIYKRREVELLIEIKKLLHEEGFTIAGARQKFSQRRKKELQEIKGPSNEELQKRISAVEKEHRKLLEDIKNQIKDLISLVDE